MGQMYFTANNVGAAKRLKIQSDVCKIDLHDETVIRWKRQEFEPPQKDEAVRVAAFDLDETLTRTKTGTPFARHGHDWRLIEHMTAHLDALTRHGKQRTIVVVFTNQGGVVPQAHAKSYINILTKIGGVLEALPVISIVYAAAKAATPEKRAQYRKPGRGMFELLKQDLAPGHIDMATSFYVGDAAGRPGDHSSDDRNFAKAAKLTFYTPEEWLESEHVVKRTPIDSTAEPSSTTDASKLPESESRGGIASSSKEKDANQPQLSAENTPEQVASTSERSPKKDSTNEPSTSL